MEEFEILQAFEDRMEAEVAQSYLESYGIESIIRVDNEGGMLGGFQLGAQGVLLYVKKSEKEKAFQVLRTKNTA